MKHGAFVSLVAAGLFAVTALSGRAAPDPYVVSGFSRTSADLRTSTDSRTRTGLQAAQAGAVRPVNRVAPNAVPPAVDAAFLKQYRLTCHNARTKAGELVLEGRDLAQIRSEAETWEKVVKKIRTGMMPPSGAPRPERAALDSFARALEAHLDSGGLPIGGHGRARAPPPEPDRVHERHPRPARSRARRHDAAARRWLERRVRQHR